MNHPRSALLVVAALIAVGHVSPAFAEEPFGGENAFAELSFTQQSFAAGDFPVGMSEFALSIGYANISLGSDSVINNESALRIEGSLSFSPLRDQLPQLRLGAAVAGSMILDNSNRTIISNNGNFVFVGSSDVPFWLLEPELRVSWRQTFGDYGQFFIEPGLAGGVAFGFVDLDAADASGDSFKESDNAFYGRVYLRAGAHVTGGLAGLEASWLSAGQLDFGADNAKGDLSEWYIGVFGALLF